jgi:hypothetical protein
MTPVGEPFDTGGPGRPECGGGPGQQRAGTGDARPGPAGLPSRQCTPRRSTTKINVSLGLITPPAPRAP